MVSETTRALTTVFVNPALTAVQLVPSFVERNTPLSVPAKRVPPIVARARTEVLVSPALTAVHIAPLFVERKTPSPPAKRIVSPPPPEVILIAKHRMFPPQGPFVCTHCVDAEGQNRTRVSARQNGFAFISLSPKAFVAGIIEVPDHGLVGVGSAAGGWRRVQSGGSMADETIVRNLT
jgi:hypothetical protein